MAESGLDGEARTRAERAQAIEDGEPEPLEPPFPYAVRPFRPAFFRMPASPGPGPASKSTEDLG